jgi:hypothetical protein
MDVDGQVRGPGEVGGHEHDGHQRVSNHEGAILNLVQSKRTVQE